MKALAKARGQKDDVSERVRLRVLCPEDDCPVMAELIELREHQVETRFETGAFLLGGLTAGLVLWVATKVRRR
jgi:hypothetical protein